MNRFRLYRTFFIVGLVGLFVSMLFMHYSSTKRIESIFLQEREEKLLSASRLVRAFFGESVSKLKFLGMELGKDLSLSRVRALLKSFYECSEGKVLAVQWIDKEGTLKEGFPPEHTPYGYSFKETEGSWDFFNRVVNSKDVVFSNSITLSEGDIGLTIAYPVRGEQGEFLGAVAFIISYAKNIGLRLLDVKNLFLVDARSGKVVFSSKGASFLGKQFKEVFNIELSSLGEGFSHKQAEFQGEKAFIISDRVSLLSGDWYVVLLSFNPFYTLFGFVPGIGVYLTFTLLFLIVTVFFAFLLVKEFETQGRKLKKERDFTGRALASIGMPLLILDKGGRVSFANEFALSLFGSDIEGKQCPFLLKYPSFCLLHEELEKTGAVRSEFKLDEKRVFEVNCFSIRGESGDFEGVLSLARDVTENKKAEHRLWDLARRLERKIWEEHILFELSKVVALHREREALIREIMDMIYAYFPTTLTFIGFLEERWRALKVVGMRGGRKEVKDLLILEKGLSKVVDLGEILYIPDTRGVFSIGKSFEVETLSELVIPLIARGSTFGVLFLGSDKVNAFPEEDRNILKAAADMIAIGMDNVMLYEKLDNLATTDDLTGLYNRRFFYQRLSEEIARAKRQGGNLFLMLIDLDKFKLYNDTFGHIAGDKLLRNFGKVLGDAIRKGMDYAFRYGGDEFAVILSSLTEEGVLKVCSRITREFERYEFEVVGLSFGIAEYEEGMTEEALIGAADMALYEAKRRGGRTAVFYRELSGSTSPAAEPSTDPSYPSYPSAT